MSLTASIREQVRQRAQCACEFCGITEVDTGGMLTIDHFQPCSKAGSDALDNLIYACIGSIVLPNLRAYSGDREFVRWGG
jgi:5-methylcytosine-specific restriction endonuclease McrA